MDIALENAGPEYDILMDGVVRYASYVFVTVINVEGKAYNSTEMRTAMGALEYDEWLSYHETYSKHVKKQAFN
ncbi:hypothetical protein [Zunongwangia sp. H14]|uniref:hypothetical protein n=1 Tax=Zunongwangia sp. H14 TaxID=3240792 RepID=UPI003569DC55